MRSVEPLITGRTLEEKVDKMRTHSEDEIRETNYTIIFKKGGGRVGQDGLLNGSSLQTHLREKTRRRGEECGR